MRKKNRTVKLHDNLVSSDSWIYAVDSLKKPILHPQNYKEKKKRKKEEPWLVHRL
jgi:hypothetical protein